MRPISKFGVFLALAAILAFLFAVMPQSQRDKKLPTPPVEQERADVSAKKATRHIPGPMSGPGEEAATSAISTRTGTPSATRLNFPAIRGGSNYGWVQLPHGTPVDFVSQNGRDLWVRWDGILVRIDALAAARGAVVLKTPAPVKSRG